MHDAQAHGHQTVTFRSETPIAKQSSPQVSRAGKIQEYSSRIYQQDLLARCSTWMGQAGNDARI